MKALVVINAFVHKRTGKRVEPGAPLPEGLGGEAIKRLRRAGCVAEVEAEPPAKAANDNAPLAKRTKGTKAAKPAKAEPENPS